MKKILIIEDNKLNLELLEQLLHDEYIIFSAVDGRAGLKSVKENHPDLIILDVSLPIIDGYEISRIIKNDEKLKDIIIIGLSSRAMTGDDRKAKYAGFDEYLTKPLDETLLFKKLDKYLKND